jgi:hypothetical protein
MVTLTSPTIRSAPIVITPIHSTPYVATTTDERGSTVIVTITPGGVVSEVILVTTTLPDGNVQTLTSYTYVPVASQVAASSSAVPQLQNGGAMEYTEKPKTVKLVGVLVAAIALGGLLL